MARLIPEPKEWRRTSCTMPVEIWTRLEAVVKAVNSTRPAQEQYSRDEFMAECLDWAMQELEAEKIDFKKGKVR